MVNVPFSYVYSLVNENAQKYEYSFSQQPKMPKFRLLPEPILLFVFVAIVCVWGFFVICFSVEFHIQFSYITLFRAFNVIPNQLKYVCVHTQNGFNVC